MKSTNPDNVSLLRLAAIFMALLAPMLPASAAEAPAARTGRAKQVQRFQATLKELRVLQTAASREEAAWRVEKQDLERLTNLAQIEANQTQDENHKLQAEARTLDAELAKAKRANANANAQVAALKSALVECASQLKRCLTTTNVPAPETMVAGVDRLLVKSASKDASCADLASDVWALTLEWLAWTGEVEAKHSQLTISGAVRDVFVLRLGNAAEFAASADGAAAWVWKGSSNAWANLPVERAADLLNAIDVVRKRRAAVIAVLPLVEMPAAPTRGGAQP